MVTYSEGIQAVLDHITTRWTATDVVLEGDRYERPAGPFVLVEVESGSGRPEWLGTAGYRHVAALTVTCFGPTDQGAGVLREMAEQIAALVAQRVYAGGVARTWAPAFGRVLEAQGDTGWLALELAVPLWVDVDHAAA